MTRTSNRKTKKCTYISRKKVEQFNVKDRYKSGVKTKLFPLPNKNGCKKGKDKTKNLKTKTKITKKGKKHERKEKEKEKKNK